MNRIVSVEAGLTYEMQAARAKKLLLFKWAVQSAYVTQRMNKVGPTDSQIRKLKGGMVYNTHSHRSWVGKGRLNRFTEHGQQSTENRLSLVPQAHREWTRVRVGPTDSQGMGKGEWQGLLTCPHDTT